MISNNITVFAADSSGTIKQFQVPSFMCQNLTHPFCSVHRLIFASYYLEGSDLLLFSSLYFFLWSSIKIPKKKVVHSLPEVLIQVLKKKVKNESHVFFSFYCYLVLIIWYVHFQILCRQKHINAYHIKSF